jgi:hypothetical protein
MSTSEVFPVPNPNPNVCPLCGGLKNPQKGFDEQTLALLTTVLVAGNSANSDPNNNPLQIETAVRMAEDIMRKCGLVRLNKGVKHEFSR